jgi:hypothetical protein
MGIRAFSTAAMARLFSAEAINRPVVKPLAGPVNRAGKMWLMNGVREILGLKTQAAVRRVGGTALAGAIQVIAGIKLDAG